MSTSCPFCEAILPPHQQRRRSAVVQCPYTINRYALNNKGTVGSIYLCYCDELLCHSSVEKIDTAEENLNECPDCQVINGSTFVDNDILGIIDIEDELWISVTLDLPSSNEGMAKLRDYRMPTGCNVRFLYYHFLDRRISLNVGTTIFKQFLDILPNDMKSLHMITSVIQGIDFIIALEYPIDEDFNDVDSILIKLCEYFTKSDVEFVSLEEQQKINCLTPIIFSQSDKICSFQRKNDFSDICQCIHQYLFEQKESTPLYYKLHPINIPSCQETSNVPVYTPLDPLIFSKVREMILKFYNKLETIKCLDDKLKSFRVPESLQTFIGKAIKHISMAASVCECIQGQLALNVIKCRQGKSSWQEVDNESISKLYGLIDNRIEFLQKIIELYSQSRLIREVKTKYPLENLDAADIEDCDDDLNSLEAKILSSYNKQPIRFLFYSQELADKDSAQFRKLWKQLVDEQKADPSLRIMGVDFSDCFSQLTCMKLMPEVSKSLNSTLTRTSSIESNDLNILLLGETGVGKSTLINAFVNYLSFQTFENAQNADPILLIPVSFQITDDKLNEYKIKLGDSDSNEEFNHSGQTMTQSCKSYLFHLDNNVKLRIIDTPGICDGRGLSQDDKNIQYILSYVNNLSHINAVCILLKPDTTRLNILFRSCLKQIFDFLGPNARNNIIFCFTNSRPTFYSSGNTVSLLKNMLNDLPKESIPRFDKTNLFYYDNESLQYLIAIKSQKDIQFPDYQKRSYNESWNHSVSETIRLINFLKSCPKYRMNMWHSIKHAQIIVSSFVRPIAEAIRHILRNLILLKAENNRNFIEFNVQPISQSTSFCCSCPYETKYISNFPIVLHSVDHYSKLGCCNRCQCNDNEHFPILYILNYNSCIRKNGEFQTTIEEMRVRLLYASVLFGHFLLHMVDTIADPFLLWYDLFIREENYLCSQESSNIYNKELHSRLIELKDEYEKQLIDIRRYQENISIDEIYQRIEIVQKFDVINMQLNATKKSQLNIMKNYEHDVSSKYPEIDMSSLLNCLVTEC